MESKNFKDDSERPSKKIKKTVEEDCSSSTITPTTTTTTMENQARHSTNSCAASSSAQIDLLPAERLLRKLLLDCQESILRQKGMFDSANADDFNGRSGSNKNKNVNLMSTGSKGIPPAQQTRTQFGMWFVGGWVRDKLLGKESSDIDMALSGITGGEFAIHLKDFLSENGHADRYKEEAVQQGIPTTEIRGFYQIQRNPEKGKHLKTASAQIFGLDVDFVNLRSESTCEEENRDQVQKQEQRQNDQKELHKDIPTFSSAPEEDAFRRDANVNAIFYNLHTQQVEDYTGKGLIDIEARVLRTPLSAYVTFTDDPLRVLRLIRFASTLGGFTIGSQEDDTVQAMKDPSIQMALRSRISPERVGNELKKMMAGPDPVMAFRWIYDLRLYGAFFLDFQQDGKAVVGAKRPDILDLVCDGDGDGHGDGQDHDRDHPWPATWLRSCEVLADLLHAHDDVILAQKIVQSEDCDIIWQVAAWAPLAQLRFRESDNDSDFDADVDNALVKAATKAISATNKKADLLARSFKNLKSIQSTVKEMNSSTTPLPRSTIGVAIRSWGVTWKLQVLYSLLTELMSLKEKSQHHELLNRYSSFIQFVFEHNLQDAPTIKPVLNGSDIKKMFGLKSSGPFMKDVFDAVLRWQFDHSTSGVNGGALKEEAMTWLRTQKETLQIPDPSF